MMHGVLAGQGQCSFTSYQSILVRRLLVFLCLRINTDVVCDCFHAILWYALSLLAHTQCMVIAFGSIVLSLELTDESSVPDAATQANTIPS